MAETAQFKKIIVGVDGSDSSVQALLQAQALAVPLDVPVEAVTCWEIPQLYDRYVVLQAEDFREGAEKVQRDALAKAFGNQVPHNVTARLIHGNPKAALIGESKNASMLVLGRRGRGRFAGHLFGSVSSYLVGHAACPVLVVQPPGAGEVTSA
ncbi:universal stress protein [Arthrobacter gandavensis]|uniref:universal stress protein n=1 Tax=Arthrobacter gandavensis TaxID=169960 RepID=UPI00188E0CF1|nr:universal stress protein [Arthrobacter gandavensis]MBF4994373.1 universal stress protein [Arthrobacter gandavensis]